jgi:hypothetical protein
MREIAASMRELRGSGGLDVVPTNVTIQVRRYPYGYRSVSEAYTLVSSLQLVAYPARHVSTREIADSGGRYTADDVKIQGIDLPFTNSATGESGGYSVAQLDPAPTATQNTTTHQGTDVVYVLSAENANDTGIVGEYTLVECKRDRQFHVDLVVRRRLTTP